MNRLIPFDEIRRSVSLVQVLKATQGVDLKRRGNEWIGHCPFHDDGTPSLNVFANDTKWHCHGCGISGDVIDLVARLRSISTAEAARMLMSEAGVDASYKRPTAPPQAPAPAPPPEPNRGRAGHGCKLRNGQQVVRTFAYLNADGTTAYRKHRIEPGVDGRSKSFQYDHPATESGWLSGKGNAPSIPYRSPDLATAEVWDDLYLAEGEAQADKLAAWGLLASSLKDWRPEYGQYVEGRKVFILPDNDEAGFKLAKRAAKLIREAKGIPIRLTLPDLPDKGDILDWKGGAADLAALARDATDQNKHLRAITAEAAYKVDDYWALTANGRFINRKSFNESPPEVVNALLGDVEGQPAAIWLRQNRPVEQVVFAPNQPEIIRNKLLRESGWMEATGMTVLNRYRPPAADKGDPSKAGPWIAHVRTVYPENASHIFDYFAHYAQRPDVKVNHGIVLGGGQGIGKDTLLQPLVHAVGDWNVQEISPAEAMGRFNPFLECVILRINEARDTGDYDKFAMYERMKTWMAAPPAWHRIDAKFAQPRYALNCNGTVITSNTMSAIHLDEDDRRHYVAWSDITRADFEEGYWRKLWAFYNDDGLDHVAAWLRQRDLMSFDPKAPPPRTNAFNRVRLETLSDEDGDLFSVIDQLGQPDCLTVKDLKGQAMNSGMEDFYAWLTDHRNKRALGAKMPAAGYVRVVNPTSKSNRFKVEGTDVVIYAMSSIPEGQRLRAANEYIKRRQA